MEKLASEPDAQFSSHLVGPSRENPQRGLNEYQESYQRASRVAGQAEDKRPGLFSTRRADSKPEWLAGPDTNLVKNSSHSALLERRGNQVALAGRDSSGY